MSKYLGASNLIVTLIAAFFFMSPMLRSAELKIETSSTQDISSPYLKSSFNFKVGRFREAAYDLRNVAIVNDPNILHKIEALTILDKWRHNSYEVNYKRLIELGLDEKILISNFCKSVSTGFVVNYFVFCAEMFEGFYNELDVELGKLLKKVYKYGSGAFYDSDFIKRLVNLNELSGSLDRDSVLLKRRIVLVTKKSDCSLTSKCNIDFDLIVDAVYKFVYFGFI